MNIKLMNLFLLLGVLCYFVIKVESCHSSQTNSTEDNTQDVLSKNDLALYRSIQKFQQQQRVKRSVNEYYLELLIVVDQSMVDFHGKDLVPYVKAIMAGVQHRYKYALIDDTIQIQVTDIFQLQNSSELIDYANRSSISSSFCAWKQRAVPQQNGQHDAALFMTRAPIFGSDANENSICHDDSCAIVPDMGLASVDIITHILAHVLGALYDESSFCQLNYGNSTTRYIMSNSPKMDSHWWKWSECSINTLTKNLRNLTNNCLTRNPKGKYIKLNADHHFLGQHYSLDKQCELMNRSTPRACEYRACELLRCKQLNDSQSYCFPKIFPWADGTECGAGKWCENGQCVQADRGVIQRLKESGWAHTAEFDLKIAPKTKVTTPIFIILLICLLVCWVGCFCFGQTIPVQNILSNK